MHMIDQAETLRKLANKNILSVTAGKGGVGKTTIAVNLAICIAEKGKNTILLDADFSLGNADILLGTMSKYHMGHFIDGKVSLNAVAIDIEGISFLPSPSGIEKYVLIDDKRFSKIYNELLKTNFEYIVVDTSAGIGSNVFNFLTSSKYVVLVINPDPASVMDSYAVFKLLMKKGFSGETFVICNMCQSERDAKMSYGTLKKVSAKFLGKTPEYLGYIPKDDIISMSFRFQKPFVKLYPDSRPASLIREIAEKIIQ